MALATTAWRRAQAVIPGGVNWPAGSWKAVGGEPFLVRRGDGAYLEDTEGNRFVDWVMSWGPLVLGHADEEVVEAVREAAADGTSFGAPTEREVELAEEIVAAVPSVELVRLVSSGTEAALAAVRLARGYTSRDRIIRFEGAYHGHGDALLGESPGVPTGVAADTILCPYNDIDAIAAAVERCGEGLAAPGVTVQRVGSMLTPFFRSGPVRNFADAQAADGKRYAAFFHHLLDRGVYIAPSPFEAL